MERVAFIVEATGERLECWLNPNHVIVRRIAGIRGRRSIGGSLTGSGLADDRLLYTGGGMTQLRLKLLFDASLGRSTEEIPNVREKTATLWNLAENQGGADRYGRPPLVRFVWGKIWNFPAVVSSLAERLEFFDASGAPRRSWMSMLLTRVPEPPQGASVEPPGPIPASMPEVPADELRSHTVLGGTAGTGEDRGCGESLDSIAQMYYGDPAFWRLLAAFNNVEDPTCLEPGTVLQVPPVRILESSP